MRSECPHCGNEFEVFDRLAGRRVKCPRCGEQSIEIVLAADYQVMQYGDGKLYMGERNTGSGYNTMRVYCAECGEQWGSLNELQEDLPPCPPE